MQKQFLKKKDERRHVLQNNITVKIVRYWNNDRKYINATE